jgi:L-ribulokinase
MFHFPSCQKSRNYRAGQTGLLRLTWDNGDRTVLVNAAAADAGWKLTHTAQDERSRRREGPRISCAQILERMEQYGVQVHRVINGGGTQKNSKLNQVYADILGKPVLVLRVITSEGSVFRVCGGRSFPSIEQAQTSCAPATKFSNPSPACRIELYPCIASCTLRLGKGRGASGTGDVLPEIRRIGAEVRGSSDAGGATSGGVGGEPELKVARVGGGYARHQRESAAKRAGGQIKPSGGHETMRAE